MFNNVRIMKKSGHYLLEVICRAISPGLNTFDADRQGKHICFQILDDYFM